MYQFKAKIKKTEDHIDSYQKLVKTVLMNVNKLPDENERHDKTKIYFEK